METTMRSELRGCQLAALVMVACTSTEPKAPIKLGLVTSLEVEEGLAGDVGIAQLAIDEINRAGGINGHLLELVVKDEGEEPEIGAGRIQELVDEGAVGAIGWAFSSSLEVAYPVARDAAFPIMSPSSTAPSLSTVNDGGYMFRAVANDSVQSLAMAHYMTALAQPAITRVTLVFEEGAYGEGLADAFEVAFESSGGTVEARVAYISGDPGSDEAAAAQVMDDIADLPDRPAWIVLVSGEEDDAAAILKDWSDRPAWSDLRWFFTDGVRSSGILIAEGDGSIGTAPTFPTLGDAYGVLHDAYAARFPSFELDQESFAPNLWDSVFLFAAALAAQEAAAEPFGGSRLRDRLTQVSKGPGLILHAGQWRDIIGTLLRGNDIDYDGASGPFDLDPSGEPIGPYEVWKIVPDDDEYVFEQAIYIDAKTIGALRP
jgi:ABC-type branched-subunit amino acid transport system substrate-binding protein